MIYHHSFARGKRIIKIRQQFVKLQLKRWKTNFHSNIIWYALFHMLKHCTCEEWTLTLQRYLICYTGNVTLETIHVL